VSVHGANRLGSNSTAICLVYGRLVGAAAARYALGWQGDGLSRDEIAREEGRVFDETLRGSGDANPYEIRDRLQGIMDGSAFVFRTGTGLRGALREIRDLESQAYRNVQDPVRQYNTNLLHVLELDSLLTAAEVIVTGALAREESRGAHTRDDFQGTDPEWGKVNLAIRQAGDGSMQVQKEPLPQMPDDLRKLFEETKA